MASSDHILFTQYLPLATSNQPVPSSSARPQPSSSSSPPNRLVAELPTELLYQIFDALPSLDHSLDLLSTSLVCRRWRRPSQSVLWRYLRFPAVNCVDSFAYAAQQRPDLAALARRLNFFTDEPEYLASLDADAVFSAMESLTGLTRFEVTVPYASGELYDSLCEELSKSPVEEVMLAAEEGIGRGHVQASMRFPDLKLLHLVRLGGLGDLDTLALDWSCPRFLTELILVKPDLPGEDFSFLLNHTRPTLRVLRLDFGNLTAEDTQLTEEDVSDALLRYGEHLTELYLMWPNVAYPFLNQTMVGLRSMKKIVTSGVTCDEKMDANAPPSLTFVEFHISPSNRNSTSQQQGVEQEIGRVGYFKHFWDPTFRRSNVVRYHLVTLHLAREEDEEEEEVQEEEGWSVESVDEWRDCVGRLKKAGITLTADFL